jgi:hypothetical protein
MKKITTTAVFLCLLVVTNAQNNAIFLRHDTSILVASDCNWLIPPVPAQTRSVNTIPITVVDHESTVSEWFLSAIKKGKLKAVDPFSEQPIPAKQINNWGMPADTMAVYDVNMEVAQYKVLSQELQPEKIDRIRIQQDWWLDRSTGKIFSRIGWIELLTEVNDPSGMYISHKPFCRIYY